MQKKFAIISHICRTHASAHPYFEIASCFYASEKAENTHIPAKTTLVGKTSMITICRKPASLEYLSKFGGFYLNSQRMVLDYIHCIHFSFIFYQRSKTLSWLFGNIFYRNSWIHSWRQISCNFQTPLLNWLDPTVESNWEKFSDEYFIIKLNDDIAAVVISRKYILLRGWLQPN